MSGELHLDVLRSGVQAVVAVHGDVDISTTGQLREKLVSLVSQGVRKLVLDLEGTTFMDAAGVEVLVRVLKLLSAHEGSLSVACPHEHLLKVFRISSLSDAFHVYPTREQAMAED